MTRQGTLAQYLSKVTNPQSWKQEFKNQVLELLESLAELYMIDKALETLLGNGKALNDFRDEEIRERMKTIVAGGLTPNKQSQNTGKKPLAPLVWELFNIELYPHKGSTPLNQNTEDLIEYLKIHGTENITIRKRGTCRWFTKFSEPYHVIDSLTKFLKIIGELPSHGSVNVLVDEVIGFNGRTRLDEQQALSIVKKYIPPPGQRATNLEELLKRIMKAFWNLAPGINPYVTFALSVDTVIAHDLLNLVNNNQADFTELARILDYVALEDSRNSGNIVYSTPCSAKKVNIDEVLRKVLQAQIQALRHVLLYMVVSEEKCGRPGRFDHVMNWVHEFCCYTYCVGCIGRWKITGVAYGFEKLVFGSSTLKDYIRSHMLQEIGRILQRVSKRRNIDVRNLLEEMFRSYGDSIDIFDVGSKASSLRKYSKFWNTVYEIRDIGLLYSPAFTLHPCSNSYHEVMSNDLMLNFRDFREELEDLLKRYGNSRGNSGITSG